MWMYKNRSLKIAQLKNQTEQWLAIRTWFNSRYEYANKEPKGLSLNSWFDAQARTDMPTLTPWSAPIIWEGTVGKPVLDNYYKQQKVTIGLTVFAIGR
nr:N-acetyllactosaminide alpha-1,3-galactosyltransferase-like [Zootoca vivipara]